jgi:hypothetical protein
MFENELYKQIAAMQEKDTFQYELNNDEWWNNLSEKEREHAFYAVVKRIVQAEVQEQGSYRHAIYSVFGFDESMYGRGIDCGYISLHGLIQSGIQLQKMKSVNRFEVIDDKGRTYVKYLQGAERAKYCLQDDDRTLKVFIDTDPQEY